MKLKITHTTSYKYDQPVNYGLQQIRLTPQDNNQQTILDWNIEIEGGAVELEFLDHHRNHTMLVQAEQGKTEVRFTARGEIETTDTSGILGMVYGTAPLWHFMTHTPRTQAGPQTKKLARTIDKSGDLLSDLHNLSRQIIEAAPYNTNSTFADTTPEQSLTAGGGVCQDHAQIFIAATRAAGVPARYVSGYLLMDDRIDQDASHAWAEAFIEGLGWIGFDVSNHISPDERYVRLATGLDSHDAAPIQGLRLGSSHEDMVVSLQVQQ